MACCLLRDTPPTPIVSAPQPRTRGWFIVVAQLSGDHRNSGDWVFLQVDAALFWLCRK